MYTWSNIEEIFENLHKSDCKYIILRNYEEIDGDNFYTAGHADIDFLTNNAKKFVGILHAIPRFSVDDGIHYIVKINETEVVIDVRTVGDGYYDTKWEKKLLKNRCMLDGRFYIAEPVDYYFSLVYHAILQKKELSDEYLYKLNEMARELDINANKEEEHLYMLECYMKKKKYYYTLPYDIWVVLQKDKVKQTMVKKSLKVYLRDAKIKILQVASKIKRKIIKTN